MRHSILLLTLFLSVTANAQFDRLFYTDIDFKETRVDSLDFKPDSILIIGMGSSIERAFLNDLSEYLIKEFSKKKIFATYNYLGKTASVAKEQYNKIDKSGYKTLLFFIPKDTGIVDTKYVEANLLIPIPNGIADVYAYRNRTSFEQTFEVQFFKLDNPLVKVWSAIIDIDFEPGKKGGSKKLGNKIYKRLEANKYVQ